MFIKENIMLAVAGLKANKIRALLTMLGIIIGIASVIGIVSVGNAMTSSVTSKMSDMGTTNVTVNVTERSSTNTQGNTNKQGNNSSTKQLQSVNRMTGGSMTGSRASGSGGSQGGGMSSGSRASGGGTSGAGGSQGGGSPGSANGRSSSTSTPDDKDLITSAEIKELQNEFSDKINAISLSATKASGKAKSGTAYANVSVKGTNPGYQSVKNITIKDGRYLTDNDVDNSKNVAVVSDKLVSKIFTDGSNPIGQEVKIYTSSAIYCYTIVGIYEYKSSGESSTASDAKLTTDLYIPISLVKNSATNKNYQTLTIRANDSVDITSFTTEVQTYLDTIYQKNTKWQATASNMQSMLESMTSMMSSIKIAISAIAGISLVVGGIGVMNIMLVSVRERTREIGTRKALGAKSSHIQMQFIVESIIICAVGGTIGIVLGIIFGAIGAKLMGYSVSVSPTVIAGSFTFSMAIGVFFGYYPAKKAAQLDPIEALRYE